MTKRDGRKPQPPLMINGKCKGDECASWRPRFDGVDYCSVARNDIKRMDACPLNSVSKGTRPEKTLDKFEEGKKDGTA